MFNVCNFLDHERIIARIYSKKVANFICLGLKEEFLIATYNICEGWMAEFIANEARQLMYQ